MLRRRRGIILPPDADATPDAGPRSPLVVALVRAYRWQQMLDSGEVSSLDELVDRYDVDRSYVGRIIKVAMLAPDIVASILAGNEPENLSLARLTKDFAVRWEEQRTTLGFPAV